MDGKWRGNKPDKYTDIYDIQGKKYQRAREREQKREDTHPSITTNEKNGKIKDSELITYMKDINILSDIENSIIYYVPIEDGKGNVVKYQTMYIKKNNPSEIIQLPIQDINGKIIRYETIIRNIPLEKSAIDPIDFISLGGGIWMSFAKGLAKTAPKFGINLYKSNVTIKQISNGVLFLKVIGQEISKQIFEKIAKFGINTLDEKNTKGN